MRRTVGPAIFHAIQQRLGVAEEEFKEGNPSFFEALENQEISGKPLIYFSCLWAIEYLSGIPVHETQRNHKSQSGVGRDGL